MIIVPSNVSASGFGVKQTITVGTTNYMIAYNSAQSKMYVTNMGSNTVSVISTTTNTVTNTITGFSSPHGVAVNPSGAKFYVGNAGANTVSVVDATTETITKTISLTAGSSPYGLTVNPSGTKLYVCNYSAGTVQVISTSTEAITKTISSLSFAAYLAANSAGTKLYVARGSTANTTSVISASTESVTNNITDAEFAQLSGIAVNPAGTKIYAGTTLFSPGKVSVIDGTTETVTKVIPVGDSPRQIIVDSTGTKIYAANSTDGTISIIDASTETVTSTVAAGGSAYGMAWGPSVDSSPTLYVCNYNNGTVSVLY